jgi:HEAT repeat protein
MISGLLLVLAVPGAMVYGKQLSELGTELTSTVLNKQAKLPAYRFVVGQRLVYKLDYRNLANSDLRVLFGDLKDGSNSPNNSNPSVNGTFVNAFDNQVQGNLVITVLEQKGDRFFVSYNFSNPVVRITANGQQVTEQAQLIQTDLSREIFATLDAQGKVLAVRFDPNTSDIAQNFARTLLASIQFVTAKTQISSNEWITQEEDPNGQYIARYQTQLGGKYQKLKVRYLQPESRKKPDDARITPIITPKGELIAEFDSSAGRLLTLTGRESQSFDISGKNVGSAETTLSLNYVEQSNLNSIEIKALRNASAAREKLATAIPLSYTPSSREVEAKIQRRELGDATLETLLTELEKAEKSANNQNNTPLYLKFKALIYVHPEVCASLNERLTKSNANSLTMQMLTGALSAVGHEQAQAALVNVIKARSQDWKTLASLIPSLASVTSPTPQAENIISNLAFKSKDNRIASTAQLALGAMARNLTQNKNTSERANKIVDLFVQKLAQAKSNDDIRQYLLVLGNTGSQRAFGTIVKFTNSNQQDIRAVAFSALRWIPEKEVDILLTKALSHDADDSVRLEATVALGFREMTPANFQAQKQAFISDKAVKVRLALLKNLWEAQKQFPEVRQIVEQAVQQDASQDIRDAAANLMKMYP